MKQRACKGYDPLIYYTTDELTEMYLKEGLPLEIARERAVVVKREIERLNKAEQRLWDKVREHEVLIHDLPYKYKTIILGDEDDHE